MLRYINAKRYQVPHKFKRLWVEAERYCKTKPKGCENYELLGVAGDTVREFNGVVPLLRDKHLTHFYEVTNTYRFAGDDHIISPLSFDLTYHHTESEEK